MTFLEHHIFKAAILQNLANFYVLLTAHLSIILATDQLNAQVLVL